MLSTKYMGCFCRSEIKDGHFYKAKFWYTFVGPQNMFSNSNSNSAVSVKYLISRNYYIQINKTWYYINRINSLILFNRSYYNN
jgi:hypothetical protein